MIPVVEKMEVFPVAGYDSMELNLSGAHAPYFTRNIVILTDSNGVEGVGEVPGGEKITKTLEAVKDLVIGTKISDYKNTLNKVREWLNANVKDDVRGLQTFDLRTGVHVVTAIEAPLLDLVGKFLEVPAASLMGDGIQRTSVRFLSYLFYVADRKKTDLPYMDESDSSDEWYRLRNEEAMDPDHIVALVCRHSSCRSALLDDGGLRESRPALQRFRSHVGLPLKQPLRYFSCNGCSVRGSSSGQTQWYRYTLDLAGGQKSSYEESDADRRRLHRGHR